MGKRVRALLNRHFGQRLVCKWLVRIGVAFEVMQATHFLIGFVICEVIDIFFWHVIQWVVERAFFKRFCGEEKRRRDIVKLGSSYVKSTLHAIIASIRGIQHVYHLFQAPAVLKLQYASEQHIAYTYFPHALQESPRVMRTNLILGAYLASDLLHVILQYPNLGGMDTIAHHCAFLACALVAGHFRFAPFMFGWLIIGESSTPFLNLRWFLIRTGNTTNVFFKAVEIIFAIVFVITRFFIYGTGLFHQFYIIANGTPILVPMWVLVFVMALVVLGFVINMIWLKKIAAIALRPVRVKQPPKQNTQQNSITTHVKTE